jgi:hypothetical protein
MVEFSRTRSLKSLFESEMHKNTDSKFTSTIKHNTYTQLRSTLTKAESNQEANRLNNLIVFGIKESSEASNEMKQLSIDKVKVKNLLMSLNVEPNKVAEIKRLEHKKHDVNSRPILIKFVDYDSKAKTLKNAKWLKDISEFRNLAISPDYSKSKRLKIKTLIQIRIDLNKQLRNETPNASYYFSIKSGRITMINKHNESTTSKMIAENILSNEIKSFEREAGLIREEMILVNQYISKLNEKVANAEIENKNLTKMLDNVASNVTNMLVNINECKNNIANDMVESMKHANEALLYEIATKLQIMNG